MNPQLTTHTLTIGPQQPIGLDAQGGSKLRELSILLMVAAQPSDAWQEGYPCK